MSIYEKDLSSLAARIKHIRSNAGLTQLDFAQSLAVHKNTVGKWERGEAEPDLRSVSQICSKFGTSAYWLMNGTGPVLEKEREIKAHVEAGTKAGDIGDYKLSEVSGGPQFDATMAQLQARLIRLQSERDEAREAELRAKDEALKAKDQALEAMRALAYTAKGHAHAMDEDPETFIMQKGLPPTGRKTGTK